MSSILDVNAQVIISLFPRILTSPNGIAARLIDIDLKFIDVISNPKNNVITN
jgi:hypothetical protein